MFRIICDPSSKSIELYLTEIPSGSLMFVVCLVGVWQRILNQVCVCSVRQPVVPYTHTAGSKFAAKHRPSTRQTSVNHYE